MEPPILQQPEALTVLDVASTTKSVMKKLPEVTLAFWMMKIAATTLGETAGGLFSQTLKLGYFLTTIVLFLIFVVTLVVQLCSRRYNPFFYWTVILSTSMAGTTMSDFMNRDASTKYLSDGATSLGWGPQGLGLGYPVSATTTVRRLSCPKPASWRPESGSNTAALWGQAATMKGRPLVPFATVRPWATPVSMWVSCWPVVLSQTPMPWREPARPSTVAIEHRACTRPTGDATTLVRACQCPHWVGSRGPKERAGAGDADSKSLPCSSLCG